MTNDHDKLREFDEAPVEDDSNGEADADDATEEVSDEDVEDAVGIMALPESGSNSGDTVQIPEHLPVLPIRNSVVFPGTVTPLQINREKSRRVLDLALAGSRLIAVVTQRSPAVEDPKLDDLYRVGTACVLLKMLKTGDGSETIIVHGLRRVGIEHVTEETRFLEARVHAHSDPTDVSMEQRALVHTVRSAAERMIELSPNIPNEASTVIRSIERPGALADFLAANLPLSVIHRQEILETFDVTERIRKVNLALAAQLEVVELSHKIQEQVRGQVDKSQREYYLREQMKAIQSELGEQSAGSDRLKDLRARMEKAKLPDPVHKEADRELERMEHIPEASPEYGMVLDYVDWLVELPWSVSTTDSLDIVNAKKILDDDHYGLEKIKKRILEFLAVRTLRADAHGSILCFAGPPGVGKTSLGQSISRAMGRNFIRMSLGGVRDEASIRGHRRTYIGAMPGRIIRELRRAGSNNPVFMLDEVDKIGADVRGDPMSALLEVLDPAQNSTFADHYLGVPFDLSKVLFIATANYMQAIEPALRDRMEILELPGYTPHEKLMIAKKHLIPRQIAENGLTPDQLQFEDEAISAIIFDYTREAGVRTLERKIGAICRARAAAVVRKAEHPSLIRVGDLRPILGEKDFEQEVAANVAQPGIVTGLAFTPVGGEILFIEATKMPGRGQLTLTGQLGEVMRESAVAASSIIRSRARKLSINLKEFQSHDIHIHVPGGAIPKDGPSAGVAMLTSMASVITDKPVDPHTGMTGEITLSGRVLPIGGVREKVLAAHRAGLVRIILPERNRNDLEEVPEEVRKSLDFVFVQTIDELFDTVFRKKAPATKRKPSKLKTKSSAKTKVRARRKTKKRRKIA